MTEASRCSGPERQRYAGLSGKAGPDGDMNSPSPGKGRGGMS